MTVLSIIQNVLDETGLFDTPTTVVANSDKQVARALRLLTKAGDLLVSEKDWNVLQTEQELTLIASQAEYDLTSSAVITDEDFDRFIEDTDWDRSNYRKMRQVSASEWQYLKSSVAASAQLEKSIRRRGNDLVFDPTPDTTDTIVFEYISNKWIRSSGGAKQSSFLADTDTTVFPEPLMEAALKWRLQDSFGQKSAVALEEYNQLLARYSAGDTPARTLVAGQPRVPYNIQDTDFNL